LMQNCCQKLSGTLVKLVLNRPSIYIVSLLCGVKIFIQCKIWGFLSGDYEECRLLGCYTIWLL
jgi:hypothetical protein